MSRSRTRRIAKWTGVVMCVLVACLILTSHYVEVSLFYRGYALSLRGGGTWWMHMPMIASGGGGWHWSLKPYEYDELISWWFRFIPLGARGSVAVIPLWAPLLAIAIPTARLWRRDRRHPPGHCRECGYDLTGNVTGVCSECAEPTSIANTQ